MKPVLLIGTADTKGEELVFLAAALHGKVAVEVVDVGTRAATVPVDVPATTVAACHPDGAQAVLGGDDRGGAVTAMGVALARYLAGRGDIGGVLGIGGGGGTSIVTTGMRGLPYGLPKVMVSTMASGDTSPYVGITDIVMMPAVTDLAGLNRLNRVILHNAAQAMLGMVGHPFAGQAGKPALGLTMFGVTTPCVTAIAEALRGDHDPMIFHATGTGGRTMEKLADSGMLAGFIDITTTEVADYLCGGVLTCDADRFGALARTGLPWVGSLGACDMVNFGAPDTVPDRYKGRLFYHHNPQVTLMRTTPDECSRIGTWIGGRLSRCDGPVHLLIPEGGVSALDAPGKPFHDPAADAVLFAAVERALERALNRRVTRLPHHINDKAFAAAAVAAFRDLN